MSRLSYPSRLISVSDCHGGQAPWNPLSSPDIAARLAEGIRSDLPGLQHFDVYGAPLELLQHVVREAVRLQGENPNSDSSGLFVNSAPRTSIVSNGDPFYLAEFDEAIRIVCTPLEVLASVRDRVRRLFFLPNENNGLYGPREQHRSSFTPRLLAENHGLRLEEVSLHRFQNPQTAVS